MEKKLIKGKRRARRLALQALYQWHMSATALSEIEAQFRVANNMDSVDVEYFCCLLHTIPQQLMQIEEAFTPYIDRPIQQLNPIELTVLRIGTFELLNCPDLPYRIVLDESVSLTREFGSQDGFRYVNGVLNNLARLVRAQEVQEYNR